MAVNTQVVAGNTIETRPENRAIYPALDGLRALAFLMVFLEHYILLPWGWTGVNIFFVLSGFLITGILFDTRDDPHRARNFYVRRTLRIFPLYYTVFLAILLAWPIMQWQLSPAWWAWPLYLGNFLRFWSPAVDVAGSAAQMAADAQLHSVRFPHGIFYLGHFWSLCVEEQFYLIWPWVVFWVRSRRALLSICGAAVVLCPLLRVYVQHTAPAWIVGGELLYRVLPFQLDSLLLGGLVGLLWRGAHRERLIQVARVLVVLATIFSIVYLARTVHPSMVDWKRHYPYPDWRLTWGLSFVDIFAASLMLCILRPSGSLYHMFQLPFLRWIGRISYGAYILHDLFHNCYDFAYVHTTNVLTRHDPRFVYFWIHRGQILPPLSLAATLGLAWLSFRFLESPFLNLKERWTVRS